MKNYIKYISVLLILLILCSLLSCANSNHRELIVTSVENCPISPIRTGTHRQGIYSLENGFECTSDGAYFMCMIADGFWLLYSEHGSDSVIKLCGRPDCQHNNSDCNAFFPIGVNICYHNGYLYTYGGKTWSEGLIRLNTDGSERILLFNVSEFKQEQGYKGLQSPEIRNGIFSFVLRKTDENGNEIAQTYYYKLDGSIKEPQKALGIANIKNDGATFCGKIGYDFESKQYIFGNWDPETNTTTELFRDTQTYETGYFGSNAIYYIENGIIYEYAYDTLTRTALFDTKLKGDYRLSCFPDMIVVSDSVPWSDHMEGERLDELNLYFYNWSFQDLGNVRIDFPFDSILNHIICGETHERLILTDSTSCVPRYYINKSELGTGKITIHEYKLPDFE